jgi:hypothetical protein
MPSIRDSICATSARAAKVNVEVIIDDDLELPPIFRQLDTRKSGLRKGRERARFER